MPKGIDCAVPLTLAKAKAIRAAGYEFAARYLVPERYAWKRLTQEEAEAITSAGMKIVSVFETRADRPKGGSAAGKVDGTEAYKEAKLIGQPEGTAIYFAVDYDAQPKDYGAIEAYLKAAAQQIPGYLLGVYGSYAVVEEMAKRIPGIRIWQTYAWSRGKKSAKANIYQYKNDVTIAGHKVDLNESYGNEGWWTVGGGKEVVNQPNVWTGQTLRKGDKGLAVRDLQVMLTAAGFNPGPADGVFGSATEAAVKAAQKAFGLVVDGIAGQKTFQALRSELVKSQTQKVTSGNGRLVRLMSGTFPDVERAKKIAQEIQERYGITMYTIDA